MNKSQQDLIDYFKSMTGEDETKAKFYLEAANWDMENAYIAYSSENETLRQEGPIDGAKMKQHTEASSSQNLGPSSNAKGKSTSSSNKGPGRIANIKDILSRNEDEDESEGENYYAGGEKTGMYVQNPNKKSKGNPENEHIIQDILKKAAESGRKGANEDDTVPTLNRQPFKGVGYRLGSDEEPSNIVGKPKNEESEEEMEKVTRDLTFWRDGFSIDDGPLMRYDDPANREFLNAINSGRAPLSLLNVKYGQPVDVRVARRLDEDYKPPPKTLKPFSGVGHRLGSDFPSVSFSTSNIPGAFPSSSSTAGITSPVIESNQIDLDETKPITSIQIRLADGSRLVAKFNHDHTIGDIRRYVSQNRPSGRAFLLQTPIPVKQLTDDGKTLKELGLLNSTIVQRYT